MRLGLDIHGVIDANPKFFSELSKIAIDQGHEIYILTGTMVTQSKVDTLKKYGMVWTRIFSISDYHKSLGTTMTFQKDDNPWIDNDLWDKAKSDYCKDTNIDFHIDDTARYGELFKTAFGLYDHVNRRIDWHLDIHHNGAFLTLSPLDCFNDILTKICKK